MIERPPDNSVSGIRWPWPSKRSSRPWWTSPSRSMRSERCSSRSRSTEPCSRTPARTRASTYARERCSRMTDSIPWAARRCASTRPAGPAPMMATCVRELAKHDSRAAVLRVAIAVLVFADNWLVVRKAAHAEWTRIQHCWIALDDPLGEGATDRWRGFEAAAAIASKHVAAIDRWMSVDDWLAIVGHGDGT